MARILTRPLFRKGGLSKTPRPSYRGGGLTAIRPGYRGGGRMTGIMSGIVPRRGYADGPKTLEDYQNISKIQTLGKPKSMEEINKEIAGLGEPTPWWKFWDWSDLKGMGESTQDYVARTQWEKSPEYKQSERKRLIDERNKLIEQRKEVGLETKTALPPGEVGGPGYVPKITTGGTKEGDKTIDISTPVVSDQDTIKSYMDMFQEALGTDQDDITRDRYLQLAKFGSNLMAQPGGDLVGAIGKAAAPSIEGLAKTQAAQRAGKREINLAAIKTALSQMDPTELEKRYNFLKNKFPDKSDIEIANMLISGETGKARTQESRIISNAESLINLDPDKRLIVARSIEKSDVGFEKFRQLPKDKEGDIKKDKEGNLPKDGYYYDEEGTLYQIEKGQLGELKV